MHDLFTPTPRRHIHELNVVPIVDMFTTVIFFLLLSTSFMSFTKLTIPPSSMTPLASGTTTPPVAPKLFLARQGAEMKILLVWSGGKPGRRLETIAFEDTPVARDLLRETSRKMILDFATTYPAEKSIQISSARDVDFQSFINMMDAAQDAKVDVVLISYEESEKNFLSTPSEVKK